MHVRCCCLACCRYNPGLKIKCIISLVSFGLGAMAQRATGRATRGSLVAEPTPADNHLVLWITYAWVVYEIPSQPAVGTDHLVGKLVIKILPNVENPLAVHPVPNIHELRTNRRQHQPRRMAARSPRRRVTCQLRPGQEAAEEGRSGYATHGPATDPIRGPCTGRAGRLPPPCGAPQPPAAWPPGRRPRATPTSAGEQARAGRRLVRRRIRGRAQRHIMPGRRGGRAS